MWNQNYNPFGNQVFSTIAAALPVVTLLVLIASNKVKAHWAAIAALIVANVVAIAIFTMPAAMSLRATVLGVATGFFPIGWIVLNVIFLYRLTVATGRFETLQRAIGGVSPDRRIQLLLIAFCLGVGLPVTVALTTAQDVVALGQHLAVGARTPSPTIAGPAQLVQIGNTELDMPRLRIYGPCVRA